MKVDGTNLVVQLTARPGIDRAEATVATDDKTIVMLDAKVARLADLKEGMTVIVTSGLAGTDAPAVRISARTPRPPRPERGGGGRMSE